MPLVRLQGVCPPHYHCTFALAKKTFEDRGLIPCVTGDSTQKGQWLNQVTEQPVAARKPTRRVPELERKEAEWRGVEAKGVTIRPTVAIRLVGK